MQDIFGRYSIELETSEQQKLQQFLDIFVQKNSQINLSAIREPDDIIEKHFVDSLMLPIFIELHGQVADLGTGGGFPLIPLALTHPDTEFCGIDSVGKKIVAVNEFIDELGLSNAHGLQGRFEDIGRDEGYRENFDFVVSRATAFLPVLIEYALPLLKVGGMLCAYKLDDKEELGQSKKALSRLGAKIIKVKNYSIGDQKRVIIFIEKISATHAKYPRKNGIPLQSPIT